MLSEMVGGRQNQSYTRPHTSMCIHRQIYKQVKFFHKRSWFNFKFEKKYYLFFSVYSLRSNNMFSNHILKMYSKYT